jgi:hypothetical protein
MERKVSIKRDGDIYQTLVKLTAGRNAEDPLFARNRKAVREYRGAWAILTGGIGNGRGGPITVHDLQRFAIS